MRKLIVMRGCPGSGKSTEAQKIHSEALSSGLKSTIHSTDNYFMLEGVYTFDPNKIALHHRLNQKAAHQSMKDGVNVVIIDNTNTRFRECYEYVYAAMCYDYEVEFVEPSTPWWYAARAILRNQRSEKQLEKHARVFAERNTHHVPEAAIMKMMMRWETDPTVEKVLNAK